MDLSNLQPSNSMTTIFITSPELTMRHRFCSLRICSQGYGLQLHSRLSEVIVRQTYRQTDNLRMVTSGDVIKMVAIPFDLP